MQSAFHRSYRLRAHLIQMPNEGRGPRGGLKAMREKRGLTQRKLAHDLGIGQNYIPAIEARLTSRRPEAARAAGQVFRLPVPGPVRGGAGG
jgi:DNA-binding XRE family transcriptional regulator